MFCCCCFALSPDLLFLSCLAIFCLETFEGGAVIAYILAVGRVDVRVEDSRVHQGVESFKLFLGGTNMPFLIVLFLSCLAFLFGNM